MTVEAALHPGAAALGLRALARRLPPADWPTTVRADAVAERTGWLPLGTRATVPFLSWHLVEKVVLVGLVCSVLCQVYPGQTASALRVFAVAGLAVVLNAVLSAWRGRRAELGWRRSTRSLGSGG